MQKTLDILEKNVQWFALGLGAIFLLWVVGAYVVKPPASVSIDRKPLTAGEVAEYTAQGPVRDISSQIESQKTPPNIPVADVVSSYKSTMQVPKSPPLPQYAFDTGVKVFNPSPGKPGPETPANPNGAIVALPQLPKAQPQQSQAGLTVVKAPEAKANAAPAAQQAADSGMDLVWVSESFVIPADALSKSFTAAFAGRQLNNPALSSTCILQVVLQRQRASSTDGAGQPAFPQGDQGIEEVAPARTVTIDPSFLKIPPATATPNDKYKYIAWAQEHPSLVYQPPFYQVIAGDAYQQPQPNSPNTAVPGSAPIPGVQPAAPTNPSSQPDKPPVIFAPRADAASSGFRFTQAEMDRRQMDRRRQLDQRGGFGGFGNQFNNPNPGNANGLIDPLKLTSDILLWAHDDTVKPAETYRYRVIYKMKNPLFNSVNIVAKELSDQFDLVSPPSDWTQPVSVPAITKFWIQAYRRDGANVDVYHWQNGEWTHKSVLIAPGDQVPGTDWTLVDVRTGAGGFVPEKDKYAMLTNDLGDISRRSLINDAADPGYQQLKDATSPNKNEANNTRRAPRSTEAPPRPRPDRSGR